MTASNADYLSVDQGPEVTHNGERDDLLTAIANAVRAHAFHDVHVLMRRLAVIDPASADQILTLIKTLAPARQS